MGIPPAFNLRHCPFPGLEAHKNVLLGCNKVGPLHPMVGGVNPGRKEAWGRGRQGEYSSQGMQALLSGFL